MQGIPAEQNELKGHADIQGAPSSTSDDHQDSDSDSDKDLVATISTGDDVPCETDSSSPALVTKTLSASYSSHELDEDDITMHQSLPLNQRTQIPSHQGKVYNILFLLLFVYIIYVKRILRTTHIVVLIQYEAFKGVVMTSVRNF